MGSCIGKSEQRQTVADSVNTFGANLLVEYRRGTEANGNIVFSPLILATAFHLVYKGADGTTKVQIDKPLNFSNPNVQSSLTEKSQDLARLKTARLIYRLYVDNSVRLNRNYVRSAETNRVVSVDFAYNAEAVQNEINKWVSRETHGLIPTLGSKRHVTGATIMALVNVQYFKGKWWYQFDPNLTESGVFHGVNGDQNVLYMTLHGRFLNYKEVPELGGVMFQLPYEEKEFDLYVFLPNEVDGWRQAEQAYPKCAVDIFKTRFSAQVVKQLKLPKWETDFTFEGLDDGLKSLGITDVFTQDSNLSAMTKNDQLRLSTVIHKAKFIVDEESTEVAETFVMAFKSTWTLQCHEIVVDRPFLYFLVDRRNTTVLFQGTQTSFS